MTEQTKIDLLCPDYGWDSPRYPQRNWWQPSCLFNQDFGLPLFSLPPGDLKLVDWLQRSVAASCWPGYMHSPLIVPDVPGAMHHPNPKMNKAETACLPEISKEQFKWRVYLDMVHFSPSEITLCISDGFLEVGGKHEERREEHGFIARCFTRKYSLPIGIDVAKITSTLSGDGILCVKAPLHESSIPADIVIPIQIKKETTEEQGEDKKREDTLERDTESRDDQKTTPKAPEVLEASSTDPTTEAPESSSTEPTTEAPESSSKEPTTEAPESSSTEPTTEAPESSSTEPITEAPESSSTEPTTEAPESSSTEPTTEAPESSSTEPTTEAPEFSSTEPTTEAPESSSTEPTTEAPESSSTEPTTEAPESSSTEPTTEAPEFSSTEPTTEAPESSFTEPITEAPEVSSTEPTTEAPEFSSTEPTKEAPEVSSTEPTTEAPEVSSAEPTTEASDHGEDCPLEPSGEEAQPGSITAGLQQHEEGKEQEEETHCEPTGESHSLAPADDEGIESLLEPSEHHEALDSPDSPDTGTADQTEHTEPALDEEFQPLEGSGEATKELSQPEKHELGKSPPHDEGLSQELEAPDTEQDHTE